MKTNRSSSASKKGKMRAITGVALREKSRPLLTCPDTGNTYRVRRPDLEDVISLGILPDNFTAQTLESLGKETPEGKLTDRLILDVELTRRASVTAALLEPRIVENPQSDDEIEYKDIPPEDREYIHRWIQRLLPDTPVKLSGGGETSVGALGNFSSEGQSGESSSSGDDGTNARPSSIANSED